MILESVDTQLATYCDNGRPIGVSDPVGYLSDLLEIKSSAEKLLMFLQRYQGGLVPPAVKSEIEPGFYTPFEEWFTEASLMNAIDRMSYEKGTLTMTRGARGEERFAVSIPELYKVRSHLINLLKTAGVALGKREPGFCNLATRETDPEWFIDEEDFDKYSPHGGCWADEELRVTFEYAWHLLPCSPFVLLDYDRPFGDDEFTHYVMGYVSANHEQIRSLYKAADRISRSERITVETILLNDDKRCFCFRRNRGIAPDARDVAGVLTVWALDEWVKYYSELDFVSFNMDDGFIIHDTSSNSVVQALVNIIATGRFGLCDVCGNPFIVKKLDKDGNAFRKHCSRSCATAAGQKNKENPSKE